MVFSWGCLTNVGPWKLKGSHGESLACGCSTDVAMAGITIPALLNNLSRETFRSDRDTQGICQGCFCFHLLESGNDLNSQWSHPLRTPPTHLVLTLHLGSSVDCPASRLFRDRQIVSCWVAGSAVSPPCSVPAWWCWAEVCFSATLHRHRQSLLPSPPPRAACVSWRAGTTTYSSFYPRRPQRTFKFKMSECLGPPVKLSKRRVKGGGPCCRRSFLFLLPEKEHFGLLWTCRYPWWKLKWSIRVTWFQTRKSADLGSNPGLATYCQEILDMLLNFLASWSPCV